MHKALDQLKLYFRQKEKTKTKATLECIPLDTLTHILKFLILPELFKNETLKHKKDLHRIICHLPQLITSSYLMSSYPISMYKQIIRQFYEYTNQSSNFHQHSALENTRWYGDERGVGFDCLVSDKKVTIEILMFSRDLYTDIIRWLCGTSSQNFSKFRIESNGVVCLHCNFCYGLKPRTYLKRNNAIPTGGTYFPEETPIQLGLDPQ